MAIAIRTTCRKPATPQTTPNNRGTSASRSTCDAHVRRIALVYKYTKRGARGSKLTPRISRALADTSITSASDIGEPLFGEYRDFGKSPPGFEGTRPLTSSTPKREADCDQVVRRPNRLHRRGETDVLGGGTSLLYDVRTPAPRPRRSRAEAWRRSSTGQERQRTGTGFINARNLDAPRNNCASSARARQANVRNDRPLKM